MTTGLITREAGLTTYPPERLFSVKEYYRMAEAGILRPDERVELIEGRVLKMYRKTPLHSACTTRINYWMHSRLDGQAEIRVHNPIDMGEFTEPEPGLIVAKLDRDEYVDHHPTPSEVFLIIEIADLSLEYDREIKAKLYAKAGVLQYCLVNLNDIQIEDHRRPIAGSYAQKQIYAGDQSFNLVAFPDVEVKATDWLLRRQH
jgi:Uma2 family endonuclease